jgi:hypothetical protein
VDARVDHEVVDLMTRFKQRRHETIPDNRNGRRPQSRQEMMAESTPCWLMPISFR